MSKSKQPKHRPGIHLYKNFGYWNWEIVGKNGQVIANSRKTYTRKGNAVKSIKTVAQLFYFQFQDNGQPMYYDHSKPDSPLQSYL